MASGLPRKGATALSTTVAAAAKSKTAPWRRRSVSRTRVGVVAEAVLQGARRVAGTVAEGARRAAWRTAESVGGLAAVAATRAGKAASEAAAAAGESMRRTALAKSESAKQLAIRGAQKTGRAVLEGGRLACRHAGAFVWANTTLAVAQVQRTLNKHSQKVAQATADLATRAISKQEQMKKNFDSKQTEVQETTERGSRQKKRDHKDLG